MTNVISDTQHAKDCNKIIRHVAGSCVSELEIDVSKAGDIVCVQTTTGKIYIHCGKSGKWLATDPCNKHFLMSAVFVYFPQFWAKVVENLGE